MSKRTDPRFVTSGPTARSITIAGVRINVGTTDECEAAAIAICGHVSLFPDDVHTTCAECGAAIVHRPHAPQRPPKVCIKCAMGLIRAAEGGAQ